MSSGPGSAPAKAPPTRRMLANCALISIASFQSGYQTALVNVLNPVLKPDGSATETVGIGAIRVHDSLRDRESFGVHAATVLLAGAVVGALSAATPADRYGRRFALQMSNVIVLIGTIPSLVTSSPGPFFLGRLLTGFGLGQNSAIMPLYLVEMATTPCRGRIGLLYQLNLTAGIFSAGALAQLFLQIDGGWRPALAIGSMPGLIQLALHSRLVESPRWLVKKSGIVAAALLCCRDRQCQVHRSLAGFVHTEVLKINNSVKITRQLNIK